jgi:4-coumarate--CoA ligase
VFQLAAFVTFEFSKVITPANDKMSTLPKDQVLPAGTIIKSPLSMNLPTIDVASYVFSSGTEKSRGTPLYFNAENPSQNFSLLEAEVHVKRFAYGLQKLGLKKGDRILLYSGNKVFFPIALWSVIAGGFIFTGSAPSASARG